MSTPNIERIDSDSGLYGNCASRDEYLDRLADEAEGAKAYLAWNFAKAAETADATAICTWAPTTTDWDAYHAGRLVDPSLTFNTFHPQRPQRLSELMTEALDCIGGPSSAELMQLILDAAKSSDTAIAKRCAELLGRMGQTFADHNV